jgi:hypothetical protein
MNWILNLLEDLKWKATDIIWSIQDKVEMWKLNRETEKDPIIEDIEVKPKKKSKKKSVKKNKKNI